jgi:hypothetical protein
MAVDYKAVLSDLEARKAQIETMIAGVKSFIASGVASSNGHVDGVVRPEDIPPHAFLGLSIADATRKFLDMVKSKQTLAHIMQSLEKGGLPPAKYNTVYAVLRRRENTVGDIFRMGEDWALTEWYPNSPHLRRRGKQPKAEPATAKEAAPAVNVLPTSPSKGTRKPPTRRTGPTIGDRAEAILAQNGGPMHLNELAEKIAATGRQVSHSSLRDLLTRNDVQGRFANLGKNMFALSASWIVSPLGKYAASLESGSDSK